MSHRAKRLCILGSTGSIGENTLRVVGDHRDRFVVAGLSAHHAAPRLLEQATQFGAPLACLTGSAANPAELPPGVRLLRGRAGLVELVEASEPDLVVVATVGYAGLAPTLRAIELGIPVALANKEVLVTAGELVMAEARRRNVPILPIDSEHNAIFQCLAGRGASRLRRIILTASGGPFRGRTRAELAAVTRAEALDHPTWQMGRKITVDSATLMNKGFEVIEVHHLFAEPVDKIEVVIHPQSIIHSLVEYSDGSMLAQMSVPDMYIPISNVLAHPQRIDNHRFAPLDLAALGTLTFERPDLEAFPCLRHAYDAVRAGGTFPTVLNAANEVAVERFLAEELRFAEIPELIDSALQAHQGVGRPELADIEAADAWARRWCESPRAAARSRKAVC